MKFIKISSPLLVSLYIANNASIAIAPKPTPFTCPNPNEIKWSASGGGWKGSATGGWIGSVQTDEKNKKPDLTSAKEATLFQDDQGEWNIRCEYMASNTSNAVMGLVVKDYTTCNIQEDQISVYCK